MIRTIGVFAGLLLTGAAYAGSDFKAEMQSGETFRAEARSNFLNVAQADLPSSDAPSDEKPRVSLVDLIGPPLSPPTQLDVEFAEQSYQRYDKKISVEEPELKALLASLQQMEVYLRNDDLDIFWYNVKLYDDLVERAQADGIQSFGFNLLRRPDTLEYKNVWFRNIHFAKGLATEALRMAETSNEWAEKYDKDRLLYSDFVHLWAKKIDIDAYIYDFMTPSERHRFIGGLSKGDVDRLKRNYEMLQQAGEVGQ